MKVAPGKSTFPPDDTAMVAHVAIPYKTAKNPAADGPKGRKTTKNWGVIGANGAVGGKNFNIKQSVVFAGTPGKRLLGGVAREASPGRVCQARADEGLSPRRRR